MDTKTLKRAAEFLGAKLSGDGMVWVHEGHNLRNTKWLVHFNPHEEEGARWLKKMELKLSVPQQYHYFSIISRGLGYDGPNIDCSLVMRVKTAPTSLCFEKIMEVI